MSILPVIITKQHPTNSQNSKKGSPSTYKERFVQKTSVRFLLGLLLSGTIGILGYRRHSLTRSGVAGAVVTGSTTLGIGGLPWALSLIFFFLSSSAFSHFRAKEKASTAEDKFSKGSQRDLGQVMANGGMATVMTLGYGLSKQPVWQEAFVAGYVGALATANADTWATELGVLSKEAPRLITTGQPTAPGTSGGISTLGTAASAAGALTLGLVFKLLRRKESTPVLPLIGLISGLAGSLFDSWLGATIQAIYFCPKCQKETEREVHNCGTKTQALRGITWMNNDVVNFLATLFGGIVAMLLALPFSRKKARQ